MDLGTPDPNNVSHPEEDIRVKKQHHDQTDQMKKANERPEFGIVSDRLAGQTIRNAHINTKSDGITLELDLIGSNIPAKLQWNKQGKLVFFYKDRPYVLKR